MSNLLNGALESFKAQYVPVADHSLRMTMDGQIAVPFHESYVAIKNEKLFKYPAAMTVNVPVYFIAKPVDQVKPGDVLKQEKTYHYVRKVENGKIHTISYHGYKRCITPMTDVLFNLNQVKVAVNLFGACNGTTAPGAINPMMLLALKDSDSKNLLPLMMMSQQGGQGMNPMMMLAFADNDGETSDLMETLLMTQVMGQGGFNMANLFGGAAATSTPVEITPTEVEADDADATPATEQA